MYKQTCKNSGKNRIQGGLVFLNDKISVMPTVDNYNCLNTYGLVNFKEIYYIVSNDTKVKKKTPDTNVF